ncbi:hypothetical protein ABH944_001567 [Caballeronia udeis]|uniref:Uncharacterized protein n=1 Tax=Caballeronia udeis TaxID=1232866 RepID=A0ABW8MDX8_9BURK
MNRTTFPRARRASRPLRSPRASQSGQALAEMIVITGGVLIVAYISLGMLGNLNDARDRSLTASRYASWERSVWFDDSHWTANYGSAVSKSDQQIRSEVAQRVLGHNTLVAATDSSRNALPTSAVPMWTDVAGKSLLGQYGDLNVSHVAANTGTIADKSMAALDTLSGVGAGVDLSFKNQETASVSLHLAYNNPSLTALWPSWNGLTFSDHGSILTNAWTPDGNVKTRAMVANAVPTAKGSLIGLALDGLAPFAPDITSLDLGRIQPDVVPADRLGTK